MVTEWTSMERCLSSMISLLHSLNACTVHTKNYVYRLLLRFKSNQFQWNIWFDVLETCIWIRWRRQAITKNIPAVGRCFRFDQLSQLFFALWCLCRIIFRKYTAFFFCFCQQFVIHSHTICIKRSNKFKLNLVEHAILVTSIFHFVAAAAVVVFAIISFGVRTC